MEFKRAVCNFDDGRIVGYVAMPFSTKPDRPVVVLVHGALRNSVVFADCAEQLIDIADVLLMDLPGHGASDPVLPANLETLSDVLSRTLAVMLPGRRALLVGESIAGTMALRIGGLNQRGPVEAVLALDPLMTTAKQWVLQSNLLTLYASPDSTDFLRSFGKECLGVSADHVRDIIYYSVLGALKVPAVIASGDRALFPSRDQANGPVVFDEVDSFVALNFFSKQVRLHRVNDTGHVMLRDAPDRCVDLIRALVAEHFGEPVRASTLGG